MDRVTVGAQPEDNGDVVISLQAVMQAAGRESDVNGRYHTLLNQVFSVEAAVKSASAELNANNISAIEEQHEAARVTVRAAKAEYDACKLQELRFRNAEEQAIAEHDKANRTYDNVKASRPKATSYPSPDELAAWEKSVEFCKVQADAAYKKRLSTARDSTLYYADLQQLADKFNAAAQVEGNLRGRLNALRGISESGGEQPTSSVHGLGAAIR